MKINKQNLGRYNYVFDYPFNLETLTFCRSLKIKFGYQNFGFSLNKWRFTRPEITLLIRKQYPDVVIATEVIKDLELVKMQKGQEEMRIARAEELKKATASNIEIKGLKEKLYDFQKVAVEFILNNNGRAILSYQMGMGKTCISLAYLIKQNIDKTLVICPATVKRVWFDEVSKWTDLKALIVNSKTELTLDKINDYQIIIVNYDILKKFFKIFNLIRFDCLIADEFHYLKNIYAKRSRIVKMIAQKIPSLLFLSGTPILNKPSELFNVLQMLDPLIWNDWYNFTLRFCNGHYDYFGYNCDGASHIEELQQKISHYFIRRTKAEVLKELPPKQFIDFPVELEVEAQLKYDLAKESFVDYLKEIKNKSIAEINRSLQCEALVKLNELRQICSEGKIPAAKDIIESMIDSGEKIVVFSVYNKPLEILHQQFIEQSVLLTGKTPELERQRVIKQFQTDDKIKVFFGGLKSAGLGISLTSACNVCLLDQPWVPADSEQAVDRVHRPGQEAEHITIYQLYSKGTIDEYMKKILDSKRELFDKLIEGKGVSSVKQTSLVNDVIKKFEEDLIN